MTNVSMVMVCAICNRVGHLFDTEICGVTGYRILCYPRNTKYCWYEVATIQKEMNRLKLIPSENEAS